MVGLVSSVSGLVGLPVVRVPEVVENVDQYVDHSVENSGSVVGMVVDLVGVMSGLVDKPDVVDLESIVVDMFGLVDISVDTESIVVDISCVVKSDVVESEVVKSEVVKSEVVKSEVAKSEVVKSAAVVLSKVGVVKSSSGVVVSIIGPFSPVTVTGSSVVTGANPQSIAGYCSLKSSRIPNKVQSCSSVQQASSRRFPVQDSRLKNEVEQVPSPKYAPDAVATIIDDKSFIF